MNEEEFWAALAPEPPPVIRVIYRLYYNDQGFPLFYSQEDLPGNYIDIDHATYVNPPKNVRVIDNKLVVSTISEVSRLRPHERGTPCHPNDVSVVVDIGKPFTRWKLI
jgi:hypothetical protein